jgi:hypothetical protein
VPGKASHETAAAVCGNGVAPVTVPSWWEAAGSTDPGRDQVCCTHTPDPYTTVTITGF